ncbi:RNA-binding protein 41 isoform 2-T2 [Vipera latastei]
MRRCGARDGEEAAASELETEGERQLKRLLRLQLDTAASLEQCVAKRHRFAPATVYRPFGEEAAGARTLPEFRALQESSGEAASLQELGLSDAEVRLWRQRAQKVAGRGLRGRPSAAFGADCLVRLRRCLAEVSLLCSSCAPETLLGQPPPHPRCPFKEPLAPPPSPHPGREEGSCPALSRCPSAGAASPHPSCLLQSPGLGAAPEAARERVRAIQEKMAERQRILSLPQHFAGSKSLSRREMEIERALFHGTDHHSFLRMLYRQDEAQPKVASETGPMAQLDAVYRELLSEPLPSLRPLEPPESPQKAAESSCSTAFTSLGAAPSAVEPVVVTEPVTCVPEEEILRSRLSKEEIRRIPRFSSYSSGEPSKVLYVKNLCRNATVNDLLPLFSRFQEKDSPPLHLRLLSGRMRGQAFLTFPTVSQAQDALELLNGFLLLGKPLILEFGRSERPASTPGPGISSALQETNS